MSDVSEMTGPGVELPLETWAEVDQPRATPTSRRIRVGRTGAWSDPETFDIDRWLAGCTQRSRRPTICSGSFAASAGQPLGAVRGRPTVGRRDGRSQELPGGPPATPPPSGNTMNRHARLPRDPFPSEAAQGQAVAPSSLSSSRKRHVVLRVKNQIGIAVNMMGLTRIRSGRRRPK
jgi:hypothetical protein